MSRSNGDRRKKDIEIYKTIKAKLESRPFQWLYKLSSIFAQFRQLSLQREDFRKQTLNVLGKLGMLCSIQSYVSIGDAGKLVLPLKRDLGIDGDIFVLHDARRKLDMVEQGSFFFQGKFIRFDYEEVKDVPIPDNSVDFVSCFMGERIVAIFLSSNS